MAEMTDQKKPMIWKELVLGFAVIESLEYHSIRTIPIVTASGSGEALFTDNLSRLAKLENDETVKGVLSVPFPTYEVTGSVTAEGEEFSKFEAGLFDLVPFNFFQYSLLSFCDLF